MLQHRRRPRAPSRLRTRRGRGERSQLAHRRPGSGHAGLPDRRRAVLSRARARRHPVPARRLVPTSSAAARRASGSVPACGSQTRAVDRPRSVPAILGRRGTARGQPLAAARGCARRDRCADGRSSVASAVTGRFRCAAAVAPVPVMPTWPRGVACAHRSNAPAVVATPRRPAPIGTQRGGARRAAVGASRRGSTWRSRSTRGSLIEQAFELRCCRSPGDRVANRVGQVARHPGPIARPALPLSTPPGSRRGCWTARPHPHLQSLLEQASGTRCCSSTDVIVTPPASGRARPVRRPKGDTRWSETRHSRWPSARSRSSSARARS